MKKKTAPRRILIAIHGFGRRKQADFEFLQQQLTDWKTVEYRSFDLYEEQRDTQKEWRLWVARAQQEVMRYMEEGAEVCLLGFSMGGVIASFLASFLPVSKLILIAPAFQYMKMETIRRLIPKYARILRQSETEFRQAVEERMLDYTYVPQFVELVNKLKPAVKQVRCPVLILQGLQDEFVPLSSARYAYRHVQSERKQLVCFEECGHELLENRRCRQDVALLIQAFLLDRWGNLS